MSLCTEQIILWQGAQDDRRDVLQFVCEWQCSVAVGKFYIIGKHFFDARQIAKRVLRDHMPLVAPYKYEFRVTEAGLMDRTRLALARKFQRVQMNSLPGVRR